MNTFACILFVLVMAAAEPPRFGQARMRSARQEDAPYPAAGFRPVQAFDLPTREDLSPPSTSYGVPASSYGAPLDIYPASQTEYGPPESSQPESNVKNGEANGDVENVERGQKKDDRDEKKEKLKEGPKNEAEVVRAQGAYYVLLPNFRLQRVQFQTESDRGSMAYTARLQYSGEERAPLYVYQSAGQPQQLQLVQLL